jgi:hypothetical protein
MRGYVFTALAALALALALPGCPAETPTVCLGPAGAPAAQPQAVCEHLRMINCPIVECTVAYEAWRASVEPASFARVSNCYAAARTCEQVSACNRACGPGGGPVIPPPPDRADGSTDGAPMEDARAQDAGGADATSTIDAETMDGATRDAAQDASEVDARRDEGPDVTNSTDAMAGDAEPADASASPDAAADGS